MINKNKLAILIDPILDMAIPVISTSVWAFSQARILIDVMNNHMLPEALRCGQYGCSCLCSHALFICNPCAA